MARRWGEMVSPCVINDRESDSDRNPITVEMTWAWIPKSELEARRQGRDQTAAIDEPSAEKSADNKEIE